MCVIIPRRACHVNACGIVVLDFFCYRFTGDKVGEWLAEKERNGESVRHNAVQFGGSLVKRKSDEWDIVDCDTVVTQLVGA